MPEKTRITVSIRADLVNEFSRLLRQVHLPRDSFLASTLPEELSYLKALPANGPKAQRVYQALKSLVGDSKRLSITLDKSLAEEVSQVCQEKGISRDEFIGAYLGFLVHGDPDGMCAPPLEKAIELLGDPRLEYSSINGTNPYDELHMSEQEVDRLMETVGKRAREEET